MWLRDRILHFYLSVIKRKGPQEASSHWIGQHNKKQIMPLVFYSLGVGRGQRNVRMPLWPSPDVRTYHTSLRQSRKRLRCWDFWDPDAVIQGTEDGRKHSKGWRMVWENLSHGQAEESPWSTTRTEGTEGNSTCPRDTWLLAASFSLLLLAPGSLLSSCGPISEFNFLWKQAGLIHMTSFHTYPLSPLPPSTLHSKSSWLSP